MGKDSPPKDTKQQYSRATIDAWLKIPLTPAERKVIEDFVNTNEVIQTLDYKLQDSFAEA